VPATGRENGRDSWKPGIAEAATLCAVCIPTDRGRRSAKLKAGRLALRAAITTQLMDRHGRAHGEARSATRVSPFCRPIAILLTATWDRSWPQPGRQQIRNFSITP